MKGCIENNETRERKKDRQTDKDKKKARREKIKSYKTGSGMAGKKERISVNRICKSNR